MAEERISELECRAKEIIQSKEERLFLKLKNCEQRLRDLYIYIPEEEDREVEKIGLMDDFLSKTVEARKQ